MIDIKVIMTLASNIAKEFEGLHEVKANRVYPYFDPVGYPTIGYGHLLSKIKNEDLSKFKDISFEEAEELLKQDMLHSITKALELSPILGDLNNTNRCASISDFIFNLGEGNYGKSTLKKKIDAGLWVEASNEIIKWDKAGGKVLGGLTKRRRVEAEYLLKDFICEV